MRSTIFALASAPGRSGVAVVRISGPSALTAGEALAGRLPPDRHHGLRTLRQISTGLPIDEALVLTFSGSRSFTGENVVEFQTHGSPAVVKAVLTELGSLEDLRLAEAGEFSRRALENGRMDLSQIEGLGDLVNAETEAQRKQALDVMQGRVSERVEAWRTDLTTAMALLEVTIDFSDEEVPDDLRLDVVDRVRKTAAEFRAEIAGQAVSERIRDGFEVAIVGRPNVGKSTLLNALAGREAAITSDVAGTTRDVIEVRMDIDGLPVTILDTAGLRESDDGLEQAGMARARDRARRASLRVFLLDDEDDEFDDLRQQEDVVVWAKGDINPRPGAVSGLTGVGLDRLMQDVSAVLSRRSAAAGSITHVRHRLCLEASLRHLTAFERDDAVVADTELLAEDLRQAVWELDTIIGRIGVEDILDVVFSSFCLGK